MAQAMQQEISLPSVLNQSYGRSITRQERETYLASTNMPKGMYCMCVCVCERKRDTNIYVRACVYLCVCERERHTFKLPPHTCRRVCVCIYMCVNICMHVCVRKRVSER